MDLINQNRFDVASQFTDPAVAAAALKPDVTFAKPRQHDENMNTVRRVLNI